MNEISFTIANVEKETGLSKDTLRMWERRYGFPAPERDPAGDRVYPEAQVEQLRLQGLQAINARLDVVDVLVDQRIHAFALVLRAVAQVEQAADFFEGHVQAAAIADKDQPLGVCLGIHAVVGLGACRGWQQAFLLVITDGFHRAVGQFRQFADLHRSNLQMGA